MYPDGMEKHMPLKAILTVMDIKLQECFLAEAIIHQNKSILMVDYLEMQ